MKAIDDLISYPLATREQILSLALRNLHAAAQEKFIQPHDIEFFIETAAQGFAHTKMEVKP